MSDEIIMPFGMHKGKYLDKLPSGYLRYLAENCDWDTKIQEAADEEWQYREKYGCHIED